MTALKEAFNRAGVHPRDVAFDLAIAKYLNSGGTIASASHRLNAASARMPGMGLKTNVDSREMLAQTRQQVEDGGAIDPAPQGHSTSAPSYSFNRGGEGHPQRVRENQQPTALPVREPAKPAVTTRGLASILGAQDAIKRGYLILMKTSDGRPWGRVGWHELDGMGRDGSMARLIKARVNPPKNQFATLDEVMTDAQFKEVFDDARKQITSV